MDTNNSIIRIHKATSYKQSIPDLHIIFEDMEYDENVSETHEKEGEKLARFIFQVIPSGTFEAFKEKIKEYDEMDYVEFQKAINGQ